MLSLWLIALHMLGDYILQTNWMAMNKLQNVGARTVHVLCYTLPFGCFATAWAHFHTPHFGTQMIAPFTIGVFVLHWITDCRRWASPIPWAPKPILVDQTLHLLELAAMGSLLL
jgi:hypothetical protein